MPLLICFCGTLKARLLLSKWIKQYFALKGPGVSPYLRVYFSVPPSALGRAAPPAYTTRL